ncbi:hypothetical protein SNEBB_006393, partial [Seison nebaliae]
EMKKFLLRLLGRKNRKTKKKRRHHRKPDSNATLLDGETILSTALSKSFSIENNVDEIEDFLGLSTRENVLKQKSKKKFEEKSDNPFELNTFHVDIVQQQPIAILRRSDIEQNKVRKDRERGEIADIERFFKLEAKESSSLGKICSFISNDNIKKDHRQKHHQKMSWNSDESLIMYDEKGRNKMRTLNKNLIRPKCLNYRTEFNVHLNDTSCLTKKMKNDMNNTLIHKKNPQLDTMNDIDDILSKTESKVELKENLEKDAIGENLIEKWVMKKKNISKEIHQYFLHK